MSRTMKIFTQIPKIMADVGAIGKDRKNTQQNYSFRGIDDLYLALQGPLHKHGVFFAPNVIEHSREERSSKNGGVLIYTVLKVQYTFFADDGSSFSVTTLGEAMDSGDKSTNKAMSAALKYALLEVFCIPTEEEKDTEYQSPDPTPKSNPYAAKNNQPGAFDGEQHNDDEYRFTFGQWKDHTLKEVAEIVGPSKMRERVLFWEDKAKKEGKPLRAEVKAAIQQIEQFIGDWENSVA